ncbi:hypothetical protein WN72_37530 [Bradyrhizobium arachidis]|uniref:Uncharacterized protein n=1 Tax=Bradyrhizobium arachidis TaxID=858423 RepID=A0AAE7NXK4_9BRAD|nr:hypothetical protein WN72_37530 [Bradyrhizobium arachidis]
MRCGCIASRASKDARPRCSRAVHPSRLPMRRRAPHGSHLRMTGMRREPGTFRHGTAPPLVR